jgi:hypothetical protein
MGCLAATLLPATLPAATITALNLEWFPGRRPQPTPEEMTSHLADTKAGFARAAADIMMITEVCDEAALREVIAEAVPGSELHVISNFTDVEDGDNRRNQQIAIIARLPAVAAWAEAWIPTSEQHRRGFAFAALKNPATGGLIMVYGLHLKSNRSDTPEEAQVNYDIRDASIRQLIEHMHAMQTRFADATIEGWVVGGDINTNHDGVFGDNVIALLEEAGFWNTWKNTPSEGRHTWKGNDRFQPGTLDYIMTKGFGQPDASLITIPREVSDHNAVFVTIPLAEAPVTEPAAP